MTESERRLEQPNGVPDRPGWYYGLWLMHGGGRGSVELWRTKDGFVIELNDVDYMQRHDLARAAIDRYLSADADTTGPREEAT